jgi:hypothetical protein
MRAVIRLLGRLARLGTAAAVFLLLLALLRFGPVFAEPPRVLAGLAGSALPLLAAAVALAVLAAVCGDGSRPRRVLPLLAGLLACLLALALVVAIRPPAGLPASVAENEAAVGVLAPRPVDLIGRDLRELPRLRRPRVSWEGELRAPVSGVYLLWAEGRGRLEVRLDDWPVLRGEGDSLRVEARVPVKAGGHRLSVSLAREAPGARLRLGWAQPSARGRGEGPRLVIPPRALGPPLPAAWWVLTDVLAWAVAALAASLVVLVPWTSRCALPAPRPTSRPEVAVAAAGYALVLALMSWPLLSDPVHLGMTDRPDGRLNAWILAWDVHALTRRPLHLFAAPAFHPLPDALAFSENLLVPALLSAPFQWLGGPVLGYNAALLVSLLVSGLGASALVHRVTGDRRAAFVAGALFAAGSHRWIRLAHLHAQVTLFLPFVVLALDRFWEERRWRTAFLAGALLALQGLSSVYLGAIAALAFSTAVLLMLVAGLPRRDLLKLLGGLALAGALLAPVIRPYLRMRAFEGVEFSLADVETYATTLESYAASGTRLYGELTQRHLDPERVQDTLFPGLVPLVLGLAGLAVAPPRYRAVAVAASALAVLLSLGPATPLYRFLHENIVLVRGVRALSRFSLLPVLCLCVLTGLALAGRRSFAPLAVLAAGLLESSHVPLGYGRWDGPSEAARWLAGRPGALAVLPLGEDDTRAMLEGVAHWRPLVNGDSGFVPRPYVRVLELLAGPLSDEGLRLLRAVGVTHLASRSPLSLPEAARFGEEGIYTLDAGEQAQSVRPGEAAATTWDGEGALVDLGAARSVSRLAFEISDEPWVERPHVLVSVDGKEWDAVDARASLADATLSLLRDPRHGRGEIRFASRPARFLRLGPLVPARRGALEVGE